jgi:hypothetical protein
MTVLDTRPPRVESPPAARCKFAVQFGQSLATRCRLNRGHHDPLHVGRGLRRFPDQAVRWLAGDRREFLTETNHEHAWDLDTGEEA